MNKEESDVIAKAFAQVSRKLADAENRILVLQYVAASLLRKGQLPAQSLEGVVEMMDNVARKLTEQQLLHLGDTNPKAANMLGIDELLSKLDSEQ